MKDNNFEARIKKHSENMMKSINAPFNISEKIDEMENCNMKKVVSFNWLKKTAYSAAGFAAAFGTKFLITALHSIHIGSRGSDIRDIAGKTWKERKR